MTKTLQLSATILCPMCQRESEERMPTTACAFFHKCRHCHALLRPLPGDCCVFCSYGSVPCPPVQRGECC